MFSHCSSVGFNGLGGFGALGQTRVQQGGLGIDDYYRKGTPFLFIAQETAVSPALSFDPAESARAALASTLSSAGYQVSVIYGSPSMLKFGSGGGVLEVSGTQGIDRAKSFHIRDQIIGAAKAAGFTKLDGVQFNVQVPASSWRVGSSGVNTQWGDTTPVEPVSVFDSFGLPDLAGDSNFMGGTFKNLMLYAGLGLAAFFLISTVRK